MLPWIHHEEMRARGLHAYDARGRQVSRVRACRAAEGGIDVRALVFVDAPRGRVTYDTKREAEMAAVDSDEKAVEAEMFIKGGTIREKSTA